MGRKINFGIWISNSNKKLPFGMCSKYSEIFFKNFNVLRVPKGAKISKNRHFS